MTQLRHAASGRRQNPDVIARPDPPTRFVVISINTLPSVSDPVPGPLRTFPPCGYSCRRGVQLPRAPIQAFRRLGGPPPGFVTRGATHVADCPCTRRSPRPVRAVAGGPRRRFAALASWVSRRWRWWGTAAAIHARVQGASCRPRGHETWSPWAAPTPTPVTPGGWHRRTGLTNRGSPLYAACGRPALGPQRSSPRRALPECRQAVGRSGTRAVLEGRPVLLAAWRAARVGAAPGVSGLRRPNAGSDRLGTVAHRRWPG